MKIAFYAPLKAPTSPTPSGDRLVAQNLIKALGHGGHDVHVATDYSSKELYGDRHIQEMHHKQTQFLAQVMIQKYRASPIDLWFTYHNYHKAPDYIGPVVAHALSIPYVLAEASHAPKQATGPWALGFSAAQRAIQYADLIFNLNPDDVPCLKNITPAPLVPLLPFLEKPLCPVLNRSVFPLDPTKPWIITVAMMRLGSKRDSYDLLAESLSGLDPTSYELICIGDGPQAKHVQGVLKKAQPSTLFLGEKSEAEIYSILPLADLFAWPAKKESFGMAILQAQACGVPVVAGHTPGVAQLVDHDQTGFLTPMGDSMAFRSSIETLLADPSLRRTFGHAASQKYLTSHSLSAAAATLKIHLHSLQRQAA